MITKAQREILLTASHREHGNICPIVGAYASDEERYVVRLVRRGWAFMDGPTPRITEAGINALTIRNSHPGDDVVEAYFNYPCDGLSGIASRLGSSLDDVAATLVARGLPFRRGVGE